MAAVHCLTHTDHTMLRSKVHTVIVTRMQKLYPKLKLSTNAKIRNTTLSQQLFKIQTILSAI